MINDFMYIGNIMRDNSLHKDHKTIEVLAMSCRGYEPRKFKYKEL